MVLIFAVPGDGLAADVREKLAEKGRESLLIPPPDPFSPFRLSWRLPPPAPAHLEIAGRRLDMDAIRGVLVRALPGLPQAFDPSADADYLRMEWSAAMVGWLRAVPAVVVNPPRPGASFRPATLYSHAAHFRSAGLQLPRVLVTDSLTQGRRFFRECGGRALLVPGCAGDAVPLREERAIPAGVNCLLSFPQGTVRRIHVTALQAFSEVMEEDLLEGSPEYLLNGPLAERCRAFLKRVGLPFLELTVVSGASGDVVIGAADLPAARFGDARYRRRVAGVLSGLLAGRRREARS